MKLNIDTSVYQKVVNSVAAVGMVVIVLFVVAIASQKKTTTINPYEAAHVHEYVIGEPEPLTVAEWDQLQHQLGSDSQWDSENEPDVVGDPHIAGSLPPRDEWLPKFNKTKRAMIRNGYPLCQGCGRSPESCGKHSHDLHHVVSVLRIETENLSPSLKWDSANMILLCRPSVETRRNEADLGCHFKLGHSGVSWSESNPNVREDAAKNFKQVHGKKSYDQLVEEYYENPISLPKTKSSHKSNQPAKRTVAP